MLGGQHTSLLAVKASDAPPPPSDSVELAAAEAEESDGDFSADGNGPDGERHRQTGSRGITLFLGGWSTSGWVVSTLQVC